MKTGKLPGKNPEKGDVTLFSTQKSVVAVDSPMKGMILGIIKAGDISFDEIVTRTGKAKSTISVHIRDLEEAGLISSRPDPEDQRRRILTLTSKPIGRLTNNDRDVSFQEESQTAGSLPFTDGDIASFFIYTLRAFRTEAMTLGINMDPVLERTGYRIGSTLVPLVADLSLKGKILKMDQFWQKYGLGSMRLISEDPITLEVKGCFECMDLPVTGHGTCAFDTGILTALFAKEMENLAQVTEVECYSSGFDHCTFIITKKTL
ncbi:MAG: V4R domain-containing protein [Methanobacteriota archaeon]